MCGEIHRPQCDVPYCQCTPKARHHGVQFCDAHWRKVSHGTFKALAEAGKGFGTKEGMPSWEAARAAAVTEAVAADKTAEQMALI